ncbi:ribose/xylose/arabinose/galactoside ABC transporter permease [Gluconacetobacter johannae DSM 13595]|uniref:ABC transporter permease n=1 Tax=Gluconacetobacter johannae TaxID=112140 RepID=UPI001C802A0E|nr:ABC transporter permease [Gluconacetobacter johannae]GBQ80860.1 ribose/xylose/arabinose/galactoside ABC transporter permease [Gluconacetobacter johannae DSM 13595]
MTFTERMRRHFPWMTLLAALLVVGITDIRFLLPENLVGLASDIVPLFIMAEGMTLVIYIGGIDLSSQSVANMATVLTTLGLPALGVGSGGAVALAGLAFGAASGLVTTRWKVPSFISTLAVGGIALSVAQFASGQRALHMDAEMRRQAFGWMLGRTMGVPHELLIALALGAIAWFVQTRMTAGRIFKAIGTAEPVAVASGVRVGRYKILAFALSGMFAAIAGVMFSVRLSGGSPTLAEGFLLPAIVAVLVGGTPLTGGVGGVLNTLIGALIVAVVRASMLYLNIPATGQQIFFGLVLITAIATTIDRTKMRVVK